jgi:hypothetical protein
MPYTGTVRLSVVKAAGSYKLAKVTARVKLDCQGDPAQIKRIIVAIPAVGEGFRRRALQLLDIADLDERLHDQGSFRDTQEGERQPVPWRDLGLLRARGREVDRHT